MACSSTPMLARLPAITLTSGIRGLRTNDLKRARVEQGLEYEKEVQTCLNTIGMVLERTGASHDRGMDLVGSWNLPGSRLDIIAQCKKWQKPVSVNVLRELEGTHAAVFEREKNLLRLLVTASTFSPHALQVRNLHSSLE
jgi:hypothetical protein